MWVNGMRASRPSDGFERGVGSALVVLPGSDPGQADLTVIEPPASPSPSPTASPTPPSAALRTQGTADPEQPLVSPVLGGNPIAGWTAAASDPGSVGGLADAMATQGVRLSPDLQRARAVYENSR
jgi:hypothetical protein